MRELNEKELEQVSGGYFGYAGGSAEAGSIINIRKGVAGTTSGASLLVTHDLVVAGAENMTVASGKFSGSVCSGASVTGKVC